MFHKKAQATIDSLIGATTRMEGNVVFQGGLRIDGYVRGDVIAGEGSEQFRFTSAVATFCIQLMFGVRIASAGCSCPVCVDRTRRADPGAGYPWCRATAEKPTVSTSNTPGVRSGDLIIEVAYLRTIVGYPGVITVRAIPKGLCG